MKYINVPVPLFVVMVIASALVVFFVILTIVDLVSEYLYQKHEMQKYRNKEKEDGRK